MRQFKTTDGQDWTIEYNIENARRVRLLMSSNPNFNSIDFLDYAALITSLNDVFFAADLLYITCKSEADARGIDEAQFGALLRGEYLFKAIAALTDEYVDFFPDPTVSQKMRELVEKMKTAQTRLCNAICDKAETLLDEVLSTSAQGSGI